ncbi:MAG TPA: hypothetical protein VK629_03300 [Steroidobacteraceae bacterium]|nr:hypothetical protein [Steroidobacteraceae bacterium]
MRTGRDPAEVAARTLDATRSNDLYVITNPDMNYEIEGRIADIQSALQKT